MSINLFGEGSPLRVIISFNTNDNHYKHYMYYHYKMCPITILISQYVEKSCNDYRYSLKQKINWQLFKNRDMLDLQ